MFRFKLLFIILFVVGLLLLGATITLAQAEPVPTATITPSPVVDPPPPAENPAPIDDASAYDFTSIEPWVLMALAVAGFVEVLKQSFLKPIRDVLTKWLDETTTAQVYQSFIWLLSLGLAYTLVVNLADGKTLFDALNFPLPNLLLAQWLSAAAVVLGESFIHNVYDFVRLKAAFPLPLLQAAELKFPPSQGASG